MVRVNFSNLENYGLVFFYGKKAKLKKPSMKRIREVWAGVVVEANGMNGEK